MLEAGAGVCRSPEARHAGGWGLRALVPRGQPDNQTDKQTDRQTDREIERQTDRQTGRQADRLLGIVQPFYLLVSEGRGSENQPPQPWCKWAYEPGSTGKHRLEPTILVPNRIPKYTLFDARIDAMIEHGCIVLRSSMNT